MRLLVPMRISLALRSAANSSRAALSTTVPKCGNTAAAAALLKKQQKQQLQRLWEQSKASKEGLDAKEKEIEKKVLEGTKVPDISNVIKKLSGGNDFESVGKLLKAARSLQDKGKAPSWALFNEALWAAVLAKSLGFLPPSILEWLETSVRQLQKQASRTESLALRLSTVRGDLPILRFMLESGSKGGEVGTGSEREKTVMHAALAFLEARKHEEFRSLWTSSGCSSVLGDVEQPEHGTYALHHAVLRDAYSRKPDPEMLRWYADSLAVHQRTPIPEQLLDDLMKPVISAHGGRIEKWKDGDGRTEKLRKWRDDYDDAKLNKLAQSMRNYMRQVVESCGRREDLERLEIMMLGLINWTRGETVVVDWLNVQNEWKNNVDNLLPSLFLVVVGRERGETGIIFSPKESDRVKVMEVTNNCEENSEIDDMCALILAVATRGYPLTNDKCRSFLKGFTEYLVKESMDVSQAILLKNYLNDAVLTHKGNMIQPAVNHSKAAQWIDKEKKELVFTVARESAGTHPFKYVDYYSLHIH